MTVEVEGITPLFMHAFSEDAMRTLEKTRMGEPQERRNISPEDEWAHACHMISGAPFKRGARYGVPATAIRSALEEAAPYIANRKVTKKLVAGTIFIVADDPEKQLVEIKAQKVVKDRRIARINNGKSPEVRYRPILHGWTMDITVQYDPTMVTPKLILALIQRAGFSVGIGDYRPQRGKGGTYGRFQLKAKS